MLLCTWLSDIIINAAQQLPKSSNVVITGLLLGQTRSFAVELQKFVQNLRTGCGHYIHIRYRTFLIVCTALALCILLVILSTKNLLLRILMFKCSQYSLIVAFLQ